MKGIGIDIVELDRLSSVSDNFVSHVLSKDEITIYNSYSGKRKIEFLGGRFAGKEAIIKCLSDYEIPVMSEISIINEKSGKPIVNYKDYNIKVSISHETHYAVAIATLE